MYFVVYIFSMSFWNTLKKPILALAPMADVTDTAFRAVIAAHGKPDVMWTEFVSADGLYHTRERHGVQDAENPLMHALRFTESERPIVAQLFGSNVETMEYAARLVAGLGFDGIDINMGCPDKSVEKQGAGAALMKNPEHARRIIAAAQKGAGSIPVSVKTRIGYSKNELATWLPELLKESPAAVTLHARTRKEMSLVPARWEHVAEAVEIRDALLSRALILGNGDIESVADAREKVAASGADGAMLGRAIFGNPWLFAGKKTEDIPIAQRLAVLLEQCYLFETYTPRKHFAVMKKHFKSYTTGMHGAAELREKLMECNSADEVAEVVALLGEN